MNLKYIAIGISILLSLLALYNFYSLALNIPYSLDDSKVFLRQFNTNFIEGDLWEKLKFFVTKTNWPHAGIMNKVTCIISYLVLGTINFKFINTIGFLCILISPFLYCYLYHKSEFLLLLLVLYTALPHHFSYWSVISTGASFTIIFSYIYFHLLHKDKLYKSLPFGFLITFMAGTGFTINILGILYVLLKKRKLVLFHLISLIFICLYFYNVFIDNPVLSSRNDDSLVPKNLKECLSLIIYFFNALFLSINRYILPIDQYYKFGYVISILITGIVLFKTRKDLKKNLLNFPTIWLLVYWLSIIFIATVMNCDKSILFNKIPPRYEAYTIPILTIVTTVLYQKFTITQYRNYIYGIVLILSSTLLFVKFNKNVAFQENNGEFRLIKHKYALLYNRHDILRGAEGRLLQNAIDNKLYKNNLDFYNSPIEFIPKSNFEDKIRINDECILLDDFAKKNNSLLIQWIVCKKLERPHKTTMDVYIKNKGKDFQKIEYDIISIQKARHINADKNKAIAFGAYNFYLSLLDLNEIVWNRNSELYLGYNNILYQVNLSNLD